MSPPRAEFPPPSRVNGAVRWLLPAALLALVPKCVLCVLAYAGLGAALGFGGPEICGGPTATDSPDMWASSLAWAGAALGVFALFAAARGCRSAPLNGTNS